LFETDGFWLLRAFNDSIDTNNSTNSSGDLSFTNLYDISVIGCLELALGWLYK